MTDKISDVLARAADLIEPEGAWTQGGYGDGGGLPTCMGGAVNVARGRMSWHTPASEMAGPFLRTLLGCSVAQWNDAPDRTQAEVVTALRAASAKALEQGL